MSISNEHHKPPKEMFPVFASPGYFRFSSRQRQIAICIRKQCIQTSLRLREDSGRTGEGTNRQVSLIEMTTHSSILPPCRLPPSHSPTFPFRDEYSYYKITGFSNNVACIRAHFYYRPCDAPGLIYQALSKLLFTLIIARS